MASITVGMERIDLRKILPGRQRPGIRHALRSLEGPSIEGITILTKRTNGVRATFFLKTREGADRLKLLRRLGRTPSVDKCMVSAGEADIILKVHVDAPAKITGFSTYLKTFREIGEVQVRD